MTYCGIMEIALEKLLKSPQLPLPYRDKLILCISGQEYIEKKHFLSLVQHDTLPGMWSKYLR